MSLLRFIPYNLIPAIVTGTTTIESITTSSRSRKLILEFTGVLTVKDAIGNLALAGDFTTSSGDTLTLVCDGTNWIERGRSVN